MSAPELRLRDLATALERAAVDDQRAGLSATGADPAVLGGLQLAADNLWAAAHTLGLPSVLAGRRGLVQAFVSAALQLALIGAGLLLVSDPARPWVLTLVVVAGFLVSQALWLAGAAWWDRRTPPAPAKSLTAMLVEVRAGMAEVAAALDVAGHESHLDAGRQLEAAATWLDDAEVEIEERRRRGSQEYRYRFGASS